MKNGISVFSKSLMMGMTLLALGAVVQDGAAEEQELEVGGVGVIGKQDQGLTYGGKLEVSF